MDRIAVIGAGPAGMFASECLLKKGYSVTLYDQMPSAGRKFLAAGSRGGLNITNTAENGDFETRYGENEERFALFLKQFSPADLRAWLLSLGVDTFTGSGGKVFPENISTSEILRRWMARLSSFPGFTFAGGHRLKGIENGKTLLFASAGADVEVQPEAAVFALGGASWSATGSDGKWTRLFSQCGIEMERFQSANCGYEAAWSEVLKEKTGSLFLKNISMTACGKTLRGEIMLTSYGLEGGLVYGLGSLIREEISKSGKCTVFLDLLPDWSVEKIIDRLGGGKGKETLSNFYRKKLHLTQAAFLLLAEIAGKEGAGNLTSIPALLKNLPVNLDRARPLEEAISSAGGVRFKNLEETLMLKDFPGWFCCGEMLDWESPTGGFLMQGCFSTAYQAALGVCAWLEKKDALSGNENLQRDSAH